MGVAVSSASVKKFIPGRGEDGRTEERKKGRKEAWFANKGAS